MEIITEDIGKQRKALKIKVTPEDYKVKVEAGLKERQKKYTFPGFRLGKAPIDIVKKHYGNDILQEALHKMVPDIMDNYVKENNLHLINHAIPLKDNYIFGENWNLDTIFEFDYELGIAPEIDLEQSFDEVINRYIVDVTDAMINDEIELMRRKYGVYSKPETTRENDYTFGEFIELDENLEEKKNGIHSRSVFAIELIPNEDERKKFIGMNVGDEIFFDLLKAVKNEAEISHLLNIKKEDINNLSSKFKFIVKEITRIDKPEITQEQFDKWYGVGTINGLEDFRHNVKLNILEKYVHHSNSQLISDIKDYMLNKLNPHIPVEYVKNMMTYNNDGKYTNEKIEEISIDLSNSYKWIYIEKALINKFNISVSNEEINNLAYHLILDRMKENKADLTDENYKKYANELKNDKEALEYLEDTIIHQKVFDTLSNFLKIDIIPLPIDVFSTKMTYQRSQ